MSARTIVVFESMFGNTRVIAEAIAEGLRESCEVTCGTVDEVAPDAASDAALVIAGGPTQNYGLAKADARSKLANARFGRGQGQLEAGRESLRGWLERLPAGRALAASFDTRFDRPKWLTGSAATKIAHVLEAKGYSMIGSQSFLVRRTGGPLLDGERERAVAWGRELAAAAKAMDVTDGLRASV